MNTITVGILTVSDSCFQGTAVDLSGPNLASLIRTMESCTLKIESCYNRCVPDDRHKIEDMIEFWVDELDVDLIITTGGTGFGPRDVTPEATRTVIEREAHGLTQLMLSESLKITPYASLYRGICGIRKETLIINTPGSKKASGEFLQAAIKCIPHALAVIKNINYTVKKDHELIQNEGQHGSCSHSHSKVDISRVARRHRNHDDLYPMIDYEVALKLVLENSSCKSTESIDLFDKQSRASVIGRVLAEDVRSAEPFPGFRASIKDGYAVKAGLGCGLYRVLGDSKAGSAPQQIKEEKWSCYRISTGAAVPDCMNAVVQVEDTRVVEEADDGCREVVVEVLVEPRVGQDIREIGSDIDKGQCLAGKGDVISGIEMGLFATLNIRRVSVFKHPTIGIMSTGDELVEPWTEASVKPGCIRDSNKVTLMYLLKSKGFDAVDCGTALDSPNDVLEKMTNALSKVDVLITTGSVSMGEKDLLKKILETDFKAKIHFGRVNMKPGKPVTFATFTFEGVPKTVFALPGNPSSASVTSHVLVLPALNKLAGRQAFKPKKIQVQVLSAINLDTRPEFMRAVLYLKTDHSGLTKVYAKTTGDQISSRLASLREANGLLCLPARSDNCTRLEIDSEVSAIVIGELNLVQSL